MLPFLFIFSSKCGPQLMIAQSVVLPLMPKTNLLVSIGWVGGRVGDDKDAVLKS